MVRVIGDAYVRIRALSDQLEDDIQKALDGSDANSKALGDRIGKSLRAGIENNLQDLDEVVKEKLNGLETKVKVDVDDTELDDVARKVQDNINEKVVVSFDADFDELQRKQREFMERFGMEAEPIKIEAVISEVSKEHVKEQMDDLIDSIEDEEAEIHPSVSEPFYRRVQARFAILGRPRSVTFSPEINEAAVAKVVTVLEALSGFRLIATTAGNISDALSNLDKSLPKIGLITQAVGGLSAALLTSVSNIFTVGLGLSQIAGAGLALPGMFTGMAFGLGATVAVFKDFASQLPTVGREFAALQNAMSTEFWSIVRDPMQDMIDTLFPEFSAGMQSVTGELGGFFSALSTSFSGELGGTLGGMFDALAESVTIATTKTDSMARIVRVLGEVGAAYLPRFATWFGDIIGKFDQWLTRSQDSGALVGWIDLGIERLKQLGEILSNTGSILAGIARAAEAAGGSQLDMLADSLGRVAEIVNGEPFQSNLIRVLQMAHYAMGQIADISGPAVTSFFENFAGLLTQILSELGPSIGNLASGLATALSTDQFDNGLLDLFQGLNEAIAAFEPMWGPLGDGVGAILTVIGQMASDFAPLLTTLLTAVGNLAVEIGPSISAVSETLSRTLGDVLERILPSVVSLVEFFVKLAATVLSNEAGLVAVGVALSVIAINMGLVNAAATASSAIKAFPFLATLVGGRAASSIASLAGETTKLGTAAGTAAGSTGRLGTAMSNALSPGGKFAKLGAGMVAFGPAGIAIAAVTAGAVALGTALGDAGVLAPSVNELATSIENLGDSTTQLDSLFQGEKSWADAEFWAGVGPNASSATSIRDLSDAFSMLEEHENAGFWDKFGGNGTSTNGLWTNSAALNQSTQSIAALDQAMANFVQQGNQDAIAKGEEYIRDAMAESGRSRAQVLKDMPLYAEGLRIQAVEQKAAAEAQRLTNAEFVSTSLAYEAAIKSVNGVTPQMISAIQEGSLAFFDFGKDIGNTELSLDGWITSLEEQVVAQENWANNMAILTERGVSEGVLMELAKLPDGAKRVEELTTASQEEIDRMNAAFSDGFAGVVDESSGKFAELSSKIVDQLAGINLNTLDPSGELAKVFSDLGYDVSDGFVTGVGDANPGAGAAGAFAGINIDTLDPSGALRRTFEALGYNVTADGFISGMTGGGSSTIDIPGRFNEFLKESFAGLVISPELAATLQSYGITIPENIAIGVSGGENSDTQVIDAIEKNLTGTPLGELPPGFVSDLNAHGAKILPGIADGIPLAEATITDLINASIAASVPKNPDGTSISLLQQYGHALPKEVGTGVMADTGSEIKTALEARIGAQIPADITSDQLAQLNSLGIAVVNGLAVGMDTNGDGTVSSVERMVALVIQTAQSGLEVNSPSRVFIRIGGFVAQGLAQGINDGIGTVTSAATALVAGLVSAFQPENIGTTVTGAGMGVIGSLIAGMDSKKPDAQNSGKGVMDGVRAGLAGVTATDQGTRMGTEVTTGIRSKFSDALSAGTSVAQGGKTGLGSQTAGVEGTAMVQTYYTAIRAMISVAIAGGTAVATAARTALGSQNGTSAGQVVGQQFAQGITSAMGGARLAGQAVNSAGVGGMAGGSAYNSGVSIGSTFANGIRATIASVRAAAQAVASAARSVLPNSPADEGPFSGSGWGGWGESIGDEVVKGLRDRAEHVRKASIEMMQGASAGISTLTSDYESAMLDLDKLIKTSGPQSGIQLSVDQNAFYRQLLGIKQDSTTKYRRSMYDLEMQLRRGVAGRKQADTIDYQADYYARQLADLEQKQAMQAEQAKYEKERAERQEEINKLRQEASRRGETIVVQVDGREIARSVRDNDRRVR